LLHHTFKDGKILKNLQFC